MDLLKRLKRGNPVAMDALGRDRLTERKCACEWPPGRHHRTGQPREAWQGHKPGVGRLSVRYDWPGRKQTVRS